MGKALVIKNVDFSDVAVDQVTIEEDVPCTGITLSANTASVTNAEDSVTITATLTPADTTDTVEWSSSNENIATVSGGVITVHGVGTATVTATCGEQTATVSVEQSTLRMNVSVVTGIYPEAITVSDTVKVVGLSGHSAQSVCGAPYNAAHIDRKVVNGSTVNPAIEIVKVPYGATKARLHTSDSGSVFGYLVIGDCTDIIEYSGGNYVSYTERKSVIYTNDQDVSYGQGIIFRADTSTNIGNADYVIFS